jgi:hypothetical protein
MICRVLFVFPLMAQMYRQAGAASKKMATECLIWEDE